MLFPKKSFNFPLFLRLMLPAFPIFVTRKLDANVDFRYFQDQ